MAIEFTVHKASATWLADFLKEDTKGIYLLDNSWSKTFLSLNEKYPKLLLNLQVWDPVLLEEVKKDKQDFENFVIILGLHLLLKWYKEKSALLEAGTLATILFLSSDDSNLEDWPEKEMETQRLGISFYDADLLAEAFRLSDNLSEFLILTKRDFLFYFHYFLLRNKPGKYQYIAVYYQEKWEHTF